MIHVDPRAVKVIEGFLKGLLKPNEISRVEAIFPYIHPVLKNEDQSWLKEEVTIYHFPRASRNSYCYHIPVKVAMVQPKGTGVLYVNQQSESGEFYDYYLMKKGKSLQVLPSPVNLFFPSDGREPKITYMGGL